VLFGIQRQVAAIAAAVSSPSDASAPALGAHVRRLVGYLLAAGVFVGLVLGLLSYAVLARIDQGFAVFG
jgi:cytosine/uracil/thiamine/allantoin permease